ncbi:hypothetical protein [Oceanisphaera sp. KMM 10153]|uniref:hypothetical protein n=1 Tax=Oceanisphaera submarina TaxID=3390193 RepID=UPI0039757781
MAGKSGDARQIKVNTGKTRAYYFFRQGGVYYQVLPKMKEEHAIKLMEELSDYPSQHCLYKWVFGVIWVMK